MPGITLKDSPDPLYRRLVDLARRHHRSFSCLRSDVTFSSRPKTGWNFANAFGQYATVIRQPSVTPMWKTGRMRAGRQGGRRVSHQRLLAEGTSLAAFNIQLAVPCNRLVAQIGRKR
jgi:hypothetical protein